MKMIDPLILSRIPHLRTQQWPRYKFPLVKFNIGAAQWLMRPPWVLTPRWHRKDVGMTSMWVIGGEGHEEPRSKSATSLLWMSGYADSQDTFKLVLFTYPIHSTYERIVRIWSIGVQDSNGPRLPAAKIETPQKLRRLSHKGIFPTNLTNHGVRCPHLILAAAQHHPPVLSYLPTRQKRQCMGHRWVRVAEVWRVSLITDDGGDGRRVYSGLIFVSAFYMASSPLRPKIVILQEIVIIIISFKDADLLYYLLPDVFTQQRRVWGMVAVERR